MSYQTVFERYEFKYIVTREKKKIILDAIEPYMQLDQYGRTTIRNIYYDTDDYRLIRNSIEKPVYKEKLRLRSYSKVRPDDTVFVELKKKYQSVVYKRRMALPEEEALHWINRMEHSKTDTQISREIDYFLDCYRNLYPAVFLSYEREAFFTREKSDFRVTFDDHILCREDEISLQASVGGTPVLSDDLVLMEIKCSGGIPLWMVKVLSANEIYRTSYSKYGEAYKALIFPGLNDYKFDYRRVVANV